MAAMRTPINEYRFDALYGSILSSQVQYIVFYSFNE